MSFYRVERLKDDYDRIASEAIKMMYEESVSDLVIKKYEGFFRSVKRVLAGFPAIG